MQIPIHPICIGNLLRARYSGEEMTQYYYRVIDMKIAAREMICLYHHPIHHFLEVFDPVFQHLRQREVLNISWTTYSEWWRARSTVSADMCYDRQSETLHVANEAGDCPDLRWRISFPGGEESIVSLLSPLNLSTISRCVSPVPRETPSDMNRIRRPDLRHILWNLKDEWGKRQQLRSE